MAVTISMIETKEFKFVPQGYDPEEVDFFLDEIVDELESLQKEIKGLRAEADRLRRAPAPVAAAPAPAPRQSTDDSAHKVLVKAQQVYDETISDAAKQADEIRREAQREADDILRETRSENSRLQNDMQSLRAAVADYRERFRRLIEEQAHLLNAAKEL